MPTFTPESFSHALGKMADDLERDFRRTIAMDMAKAGQKIARRAASDDLGGDPKFSGWRPRLATVVKSTRDGAILKPTRSSAGPWTVAEVGRNQGGASGFHGPGVNRRTGLTSRTKSGGVRKQRSRKAKRWNGRTAGFGSASDALSVMEKQLPKIADKGGRKVMQKHFDVT